MQDGSKPIGFFDSGVGGLSIWKEINNLLPLESKIYLADSFNAPYGERERDEIIGFSIKNTELLIKHHCKLIVVACNTATTNAIGYLRANYQIPFIGIEPATKPAAISTKSGKIGILATSGTFASELFLNTSRKFRGDVEIIETIGTGLVKLIETGNLTATEPLLHKYLDPMIETGVDNIVLGCTHYPFLKPIIRSFVPENIAIIDSGEAVARQTKRILSELSLLKEDCGEPIHQFYTNGNLQTLQSFLDIVGAEKYDIHELSF